MTIPAFNSWICRNSANIYSLRKHKEKLAQELDGFKELLILHSLCIPYTFGFFLDFKIAFLNIQLYFLNIRVALVPPKPKLLLMSALIVLSLALLGVTSKSQIFSILMVGGTIPSCIA